MTPKTPTLVLRMDPAFKHNMMALEFVPQGEYYVLCVSCCEEFKFTRQQFEDFLERAPSDPRMNLMGMLRYEG